MRKRRLDLARHVTVSSKSPYHNHSTVSWRLCNGHHHQDKDKDITLLASNTSLLAIFRIPSQHSRLAAVQLSHDAESHPCLLTDSDVGQGLSFIYHRAGMCTARCISRNLLVVRALQVLDRSSEARILQCYCGLGLRALPHDLHFTRNVAGVMTGPC